MSDSRWLSESIRKIEADFSRSADTHLLRVEIPGAPNIQLYLKDESIHPTGSLKHRLARSLFLYALCNGWITSRSTIVEASSGNTAISEAYFAQMLGLPFIAVMPQDTSPDKLRQIDFYGGRVHLVTPDVDPCEEAQRLAVETGGHYMDQFTFAERATDWRGNNNIAESIFAQLKDEPHPLPRWIVCAAGTGGTSATIGRYIRYRRCATQVCLADPEQSVYHDAWATGRRDLTCGRAIGGVEGIGRCKVEASFLPSVIDRCLRVPNAASFASIHVLESILRRKFGGSTGTNFWAACTLIKEMIDRGESGSIVTLICDSGDRYLSTYYNQDWLSLHQYDIRPHAQRLTHFLKNGYAEESPIKQDVPRPSRRSSGRQLSASIKTLPFLHPPLEEQVC